MPRVAVILSGCGVMDGSEIHESVLTLLALDRAGAGRVLEARLLLRIGQRIRLQAGSGRGGINVRQPPLVVGGKRLLWRSIEWSLFGLRGRAR